MKLLFIAPVPPPITGQSLAVQVFKEAASQRHNVNLIDLAKSSFNAGLSSLGRVFDIVRIWLLVWREQKNADRIYFTISESVLGNLKDLVIFWICRRKLSQTYIHLHGGEGMKKIMSAGTWLSRANAHFLKRLRGVIVLGNTQVSIYSNHVSEQKILVVPNFALDDFFVSQESVLQKFSDTRTLRILYLSNLVHGKGYKELLAAYRMLDTLSQNRIRIDFAGGFSDEAEKADFLVGLNGLHNAHYHGVVKGGLKQKLLAEAHVFCLPTYFPYEGQPISIIEAYASGCCVVTTNHAGIFDVFTPGKNGFEVVKRSPEAITECLRQLLVDAQPASMAGTTNLKLANQEFRLDKHLAKLLQVVES